MYVKLFSPVKTSKLLILGKRVYTPHHKTPRKNSKKWTLYSSKRQNSRRSVKIPAPFGPMCATVCAEKVRLIISLFFSSVSHRRRLLREARLKTRTRARSRQRAGAITFFRLGTDPRSLSSSRICNYRDRHLWERIRSDSREVYLSDVEVQDDKNQSKNGCQDDI